MKWVLEHWKISILLGKGILCHRDGWLLEIWGCGVIGCRNGMFIWGDYTGLVFSYWTTRIPWIRKEIDWMVVSVQSSCMSTLLICPQDTMSVGGREISGDGTCLVNCLALFGFALKRNCPPRTTFVIKVGLVPTGVLCERRRWNLYIAYLWDVNSPSHSGMKCGHNITFVSNGDPLHWKLI